MNMQLGAQLWLFSSLLEEGPMDEVLTRLAEAGYASVETMYDRPPQHRASLDRRGLRCYATHVALSAMPPGQELADFARRMGAQTVCVSGLLHWEERGADDYRRAADALNTWGKRLRDEGIVLHYHNHEFEFAVVEGDATGMDVLLSRLDPAVVSLCFDAGWAVRADQDPVWFLLEHAPHIGTLHLRDFRKAVSVSLGAGDLDLSSVMAVLPVLPNLQAVLVEQDPGTETPVEDMAASWRYLKERLNV